MGSQQALGDPSPKPDSCYPNVTTLGPCWIAATDLTMASAPARASVTPHLIPGQTYTVEVEPGASAGQAGQWRSSARGGLLVESDRIRMGFAPLLRALNTE